LVGELWTLLWIVFWTHASMIGPDPEIQLVADALLPEDFVISERSPFQEERCRRIAQPSGA
jgi:hypothetical protein